MTIKSKRIIASMVLAVALSSSITSGILFAKHSKTQNALNAELDEKQTQLYNILKNDSEYMQEYQAYITKLQNDFLAGKITAQTYEAVITELNTTDTFVFEYSQKPEIKETYSKELAEIENIEQRMHKNSQQLAAPAISTGFVGVIGITTGAQILLSTIEGEIEDKFNL